MAVTLRNIEESDLEMIMNWRMDPDITRYMNTDPKLTLEGQKKWLSKMKLSESDRVWMIEVDGVPAGIMNLQNIDWTNKVTSWGWYMGEKKLRSLKIAMSLEMSLCDFVFDTLHFRELRSETFSVNAAVVKIHEACGSHVDRVVQGEVVKNGTAYDVTHCLITANEWAAIKTEKKYDVVNFYGGGYKIDHIGYAVSDIQKSAKEYWLIGFVPEQSAVFDESRSVNIAFVKNAIDGTRIELIEPVGEKSPAAGALRKNTNLATPYHICYKVWNILWEVNVLKSLGFLVTAKPAGAVAMQNKSVAFLLKKDIGLIELVEE